MMCEGYVDNDLEQGCDPDSIVDCGIVNAVTAPTLKELVKKLQYQYRNIEHYEENRFETSYNETSRCGRHECVMVSIYLTKIEATDLIDCGDLFKPESL